MKNFNEYNLQIPFFNKLCDELNIKFPSEIQKKSIENILEEKNQNLNKSINIIKSEAGSGKTLVYFLYLLSYLDINDNNSIQVIYLTPTRELALQTEEYLKIFDNEKIFYKVYIGGKANLPGKIIKEKFNFKQIPKIIVGTLGKLNKAEYQAKIEGEIDSLEEEIARYYLDLFEEWDDLLKELDVTNPEQYSSLPANIAS